MSEPRVTPSQSVFDRAKAPLLLSLALIPVVYMLVRASLASRNIAYMDDIDGTLMLLLRLHEGWSWSDLGRWLFEISNEHRMVTSRLMVVLSYALTGTVNFHVMGVIGNLFVCGLCALLIRAADTTERRWIMALLLAAFLFQLEHYENFFWSGASIDHFQTPLLAAGAIVLLAAESWLAVAGALALAALATFTLAHGLVVWPVGALVLAFGRRWRQLAVWLAVATAGVAIYVSTLEFNSAHGIDVTSAGGLAHVFYYWLELMGAPLALGARPLAPFLGMGLALLLARQMWAIGLRRERIALPLALWAVGSLALVAVGRANLAGGVLSSRYYILAALAWALVIWNELSRWSDAKRPYRIMVWLVPGLAAYNLAANVTFADAARHWVADRDQATADFMRHGRDGTGPTALHRLPEHATRVIREAEQLGLFEMPRQSQELAVPVTRPGEGVASAVDRSVADENMVTIEGWAAIAGRAARAGEVRLLLRSPSNQFVLTTAAVVRPDVAAAYPREQWRDAGFRFELRRWLLPQENYQVGLLIPTEHGSELVMTGKNLQLDDEKSEVKQDRVAPNRIVYDELVLRSATTSVTAAPKKPMRVSFLDPHGNLVHVDFSGAGTLNITLASSRPLSPPLHDRGCKVAFREGLATIAIEGADRSTNVAIFAARRRPANALPAGAAGERDGLAHIASLSIASRDGWFGGVRAGNAHFAAASGLTGIHALDVRFTGPVNIGDISAYGDAQPVFQLGFARNTRIAGGNLFQPNGRALAVSGVWCLRFVTGQTAMGASLPARTNAAKLMAGDRDITAKIMEHRLAASLDTSAE